MRNLTKASLGVLLATICAPALAQSTNQTNLSANASSLQETYQDWQVVCATREKIKSCVAAQQQTRKENNQRVLVIEFSLGSNGSLAGSLVMPFGLSLADGVTLQVDEKPANKPLPFRTCLPIGCVAPFSPDKILLDAIRSGTMLKIKGTASDSGQPIQFSASLKGLVSALDRLRELPTADGVNLRR